MDILNNNKTIRFGMLGLDFFSNNLGCSALAHAFRSILINRCCEAGIDLDCSIFVQRDDYPTQCSSEATIHENIYLYSFK